MSEAPRVPRNCLACDHAELLVGYAGYGHGISARFVALLDPATRRSFWKRLIYGSTYEARSLVCPNCGHVETVLKPEDLVVLQAKLGADTKKPS